MRFRTLSRTHAFPASLLLAACIGATIGCGPAPEQQVTGSWTVEKVTLKPDLEKSPAAKIIRDMMMKSRLDIRSDKTYTMDSGSKVEGNWAIEARKLTLIPVSVDGVSLDAQRDEMRKMGFSDMADTTGQPVVLLLGKDGNTLASSASEPNQLAFRKSNAAQ